MIPWTPNWLSGAAILAAAATVALLAHWLSLRVVLRVPVPGRARGFLQTFVAATTGPSRLAVVVLALWAALPSGNFAAAVSRSIGQAIAGPRHPFPDGLTLSWFWWAPSARA